MCGLIAVHHPSQEIAHSACALGMNALVHRGPDGAGQRDVTTRLGSFSMGHRRLAILDLTDAGAQPMVDPKTENVMVYNGEIYNFRQLKTQLSQLGCQFRGNSDTEVVLAGYQVWGTEVFERLRGMFAIVLWDSNLQQIVVARDHAGMKPLYWYASEAQALTKTKLFQPSLNQNAVTNFLSFGSVLEPNSIVKNVQMLPAGSWASFELGHDQVSVPVIENFWEFPKRASESSTFDFRLGLEESVKGHLESDVPVGVFLSSGVDSTAIAEMASKFCGPQLRTLTIGFGGTSAIDETSIAEETARRLGACHQTVIVTEDEARKEVEHWLSCLDQPSLDGFNTYLVSKAAINAGLKVALSGLGGDELFGGYSGFRTIPKLVQKTKYLRLIPRSIRQQLAMWMFRGKSEAERGKAMDFARNIASPTSILFAKRRLFSDHELLSLRESSSPSSDRFGVPTGRKIPDAVLQLEDIPAAISAFEASFYMRDTLLRDSDISGMAHGLEIRMPLLDRDLMEAALQLPKSVRMGNSSAQKPALVSAAGPRTKELSTMSKRGFSLPYANWIRGPLRDLFEEGVESAILGGLVSRVPARRLFDSFVSGRSRDADWSRVWALGSLGHWLKRMKIDT
jgi:asparagine synthase (glutamine-hydrolysing)